MQRRARSRSHRWWHIVKRILFALLALLLAGLVGVVGLLLGWWGPRPWSAYEQCGASIPAELPATVRIGLYEEFPIPERLSKLEQVDFPVTLAVAAPSRAEFLRLRQEVQQHYPQVREVYFWPLLTHEEGYYPGPWSDPAGIRRLAEETEGLPVLWDLEWPLGEKKLTPANWWRNRSFLRQWISARREPTHIWRTYAASGLESPLLKLMAMHFDPRDYSAVVLHLDLYTTGSGLPADLTSRVLRCGAETYRERFIPDFGVLNDKLGPEEVFIPVETLCRNLELARAAGVSEIWLFGVNGLNDEYLQALRETVPLEKLEEKVPPVLALGKTAPPQPPRERGGEKQSTVDACDWGLGTGDWPGGAP